MLVMSTLLSWPGLGLSCCPKKNPPIFVADTEFLECWCDGGVGEVVGDGGGGDMVQVQELSCTVGATLTGLSLTGSGGHTGPGGARPNLPGAAQTQRVWSPL